jgi:hypothetical protein
LRLQTSSVIILPLIHLALEVAAALFLFAVGCAAVVVIGFFSLVLYVMVKKKLGKRP